MKLIPAVASRAVGRSVLKTRAASPTLLFGAGIVGAVGAAVLACRATLKLEETLSEIEKGRVDLPVKLNGRPDIAPIDLVKDASKIVKLYAPSVIVGTASIACLTGSHRTLNSRNAGLTVAYAALERGFNEYRERVREDVGEEKEREYRYPTELCDLADEETGKKIKGKRHIAGADSIYARFFDDSNQSWQPNHNHNMMFIKVRETYLNDLLHARGHVFLNEAYDSLGLKRSPAGAVVGWRLGNGGDDFIDFGLDTGQVNDFHQSILLDFNVDGTIYDKI